ncbi:MAG: hypothetical protein ABI629_05060 [bacterium]
MIEPLMSSAVRRRGTPLRGGLALLALVVSVAAQAIDPTYVLQPQAMQAVAPLCERLRPMWHCEDVAIDHNRVRARLCADSGDRPCFTLQLERPDDTCGDTHWGPFCARFPDEPPTAGARDAIAAALAATGNVEVWTKLEPAPQAPPQSGSAPPSFQVRSLAVAAALLIGPLAVGWLLGRAVSRYRARRGGWVFAVLGFGLPAALAFGLDAYVELIGLWDALMVGLSFGAGLLLARHRACADWRRPVLMLGSGLVTLAFLELSCRLFLPPPPAFPSSEGPALLLVDAMRAARVTGFAPTQAGATTCDAIYAVDNPHDTVPLTTFPHTWQPRAEATSRVLHLGDSMVFGSGVDGRFTDNLAQLEPSVEHVNAGIAGTAPDVYLSLTRLFVARAPFSAVVMHLTGNDRWGVDEPQYPCSDWQPLLAYDPSGVRLRYATAQPGAADRSRLRWLVQNSPPPYVLRAAVRFSSLAAYGAAAFVGTSRRLGSTAAAEDDAVHLAHLTAILRAARDELAARHIPFIVDSFHDRQVVESGIPAPNSAENEMQRAAAALGIVTIDTWQPLVDAVRGGVQPFTNAGGPTDSHFNAAGHALIAQWLHDTLPAAVERARATPAP